MKNKALIVAWIAALSLVNSPKMYAQKIDSSKAVVENFEEKGKMNIDSIELSHEEIINMNVDSLLKLYWEEIWLGIINKHMLIEINKIRDKYKAPHMRENDTLTNVAQTYSESMNSRNMLSHEDENWEKCDWRISKFLWTDNVFHIVWENIAKWQNSISQVMDHWVNYSLWHKRNIIFYFYTEAGIWYCNWYRVQNFAKIKKEK